VGDQRGTEDLDPDVADQLRRTGQSHLLAGDDLLHQRRAAAAEALGPGQPDQPRLVQLPLPAPQELEALLEAVGYLLGGGLIGGEEIPHLVADRQLVLGHQQPHQGNSV
jgi:hypothetical protein